MASLKDIDPAAFARYMAKKYPPEPRPDEKSPIDFLCEVGRKAKARAEHPLAKAEAIANADAHTNNAGLPTYSELVAALRIGKHHANMAADRAHSLASVSEQGGMHGTAATHTKSANESDQAAELIRALLARIPA
jgi:hypothetical protein